jgi:hypothetical protein
MTDVAARLSERLLGLGSRYSYFGHHDGYRYVVARGSQYLLRSFS